MSERARATVAALLLSVAGPAWAQVQPRGPNDLPQANLDPDPMDTSDLLNMLGHTQPARRQFAARELRGTARRLMRLSDPIKGASDPVTRLEAQTELGDLHTRYHGRALQLAREYPDLAATIAETFVILTDPSGLAVLEAVADEVPGKGRQRRMAKALDALRAMASQPTEAVEAP